MKIPQTLLDLTVRHRLFGGDERQIYESSLESDRRKRKNAIKALREAGVIGDEVPGTEGDFRRVYVLVDVIWPTLYEKRTYPDLGRLLNNEHMLSYIEENRTPEGAEFFVLPIEQQAWILSYPEKFRLFWAKPQYSQPLPWQIGEERPERAVTGPSSYGMHDPRLYVIDDAAEALIDAKLRDREIARRFRKSIVSGLVKVAGIVEDDAKRFVRRRSAGFGLPELPDMPDDAAEWTAEADQRLAKARLAVEEAVKHLCAVERVVATVEARGGWAKFAAEYHAAIAASVDRLMAATKAPEPMAPEVEAEAQAGL